jgi:hypothetical protein
MATLDGLRESDQLVANVRRNRSSKALAVIFLPRFDLFTERSLSDMVWLAPVLDGSGEGRSPTPRPVGRMTTGAVLWRCRVTRSIRTRTIVLTVVVALVPLLAVVAATPSHSAPPGEDNAKHKPS